MKRRPQFQEPNEIRPILVEQQEETYKTRSNTLFFSSWKGIFGICVTFRLVNAFLVQTYFNPDEHWQSLEVAHRIVFGALVITLMGFIDWIMYGSLVFVPLNFLKFNILSAGGDYYGTHKWHWYFTEGFPVMIFSYLPFSALGVQKSKQWKLFGLIIWVLGLYSVLGHKEFRFVLPVLPIALMFAGHTLAEIDHSNKRKRSFNFEVGCPSKMQLTVLFLLVTNLPMALYMSLIHQRGSEDVMKFLADEAIGGKVRSIAFLTPCHATPYYSSLHCNVSMRFLDCSPSNEKGVLDESDQFMMDPVGFMQNMKANWSFPSHIVLFEPQEKLLKEFLTSHSYKEIKRFFHAHFKVDRELQSSIVAYVLSGK